MTTKTDDGAAVPPADRTGVGAPAAVECVTAAAPSSLTRDDLALAHHRFYCHAGDPECSEVDDADFDFADFALDMIGGESK